MLLHSTAMPAPNRIRCYSKPLMRELRELLLGRRRDLDLDLAALQIATIEHPEISPGGFLEVLNSYAGELGSGSVQEQVARSSFTP